MQIQGIKREAGAVLQKSLEKQTKIWGKSATIINRLIVDHILRSNLQRFKTAIQITHIPSKMKKEKKNTETANK